MWTSILFHVQDVHVWAAGQCQHGPLLQQKKWIDPESSAMEALKIIVTSKKWLKTFPFYKMFRHTGVLESYHNMRLSYIPKRIAFRWVKQNPMFVSQGATISRVEGEQKFLWPLTLLWENVHNVSDILNREKNCEIVSFLKLKFGLACFNRYMHEIFAASKFRGFAV